MPELAMIEAVFINRLRAIIIQTAMATKGLDGALARKGLKYSVKTRVLSEQTLRELHERASFALKRRFLTLTRSVM